ncbi:MULTISPECIES: ABC transporter ATP-binding protein [Methylosinus]|uniref:ABC transporter ATP-binding protein n=1 Tax=Methylosinus trichosporium (strain ATCC 35070 / NCIMB 11131 / UNIQEM 75 / OB3b) TaxID=595536 RepID=A0A2D2D4H0_METT3|nr:MULTISPECIES: ABC transporter ATP-binding protein [Methylosinus]ATQ69897.1 ABC transporter ATP-binding protein [Methylosinus trichosporium OB3b]OBS53890.1 hypothetical protein A8B73_03740 [Methylosinus sp. 3S-1]
MTDIAIRAERLGKTYVIGHEDENLRGASFRRALARSARNLSRASLDMLRGRPIIAGDTTEEFHALRDVEFEIARGDVVGVIGRNGAGKSTLLKILSRITEPTKGRVEIAGRVASLLEIGTGFHPELSGRENVFLNGAILGMSRAEIKRKFDEIVAFARIDSFIDTPVKRYSSGMQVRLAFSVAAHLDPEILLIDEVLAVGDLEFQKKCLGKMGEIAGRDGRTVLFVSHQLGMVARLCTRGLLLSGGTLAFSGTAGEAIERYVAQSAGSNKRSFADEKRLEALPAAIVGVECVGPSGAATDHFASRDAIRVRVSLRVRQAIGGMLLGIGIENRHATRVSTWVTRLAEHMEEGQTNAEIEIEIEPDVIAPGGYTFTLALHEAGIVYHRIEDQCPIMIIDSGSQMTQFSNVDYGVVLVPARWRTRAAA